MRPLQIKSECIQCQARPTNATTIADNYRDVKECNYAIASISNDLIYLHYEFNNFTY